MTDPRAALIRIVDDDASFRSAISRLLRASGFEARAFASAEEYLRAQPIDAPGCLLLDLRMPGLDGLELQATLAGAEDPLPIIFLTGYGEIPASVKAIKSGAQDFLTKPVDREVLIAAVREAISQDAQARAARARRRELRDRYESLTPREKEVLAHVVAGKLNKQIADDLGTAERTIKAHRAKAMAKMRAESLAELVRLAEELGLPSPGSGASRIKDSSTKGQ